METLAHVGGSRRRIETEFETEKSDLWLDGYVTRTPFQVRGRLWAGWYHHITLAMLALAYLAVIRNHATTQGCPGEKGAAVSGGNRRLIPLTVPEVRRLLTRLIWTANHPADFVLSWSQWRRKHQARARQCHYQRRLSLLAPVVLL